MTIKHILLISVLVIAIYSLENKQTQNVFRGAKSEIIYRKEQTEVQTGTLYVRENMIAIIQADISNIQVRIITNSTDINKARQQMKQTLNQMRTELVTESKLVSSIRQISRPILYKKGKQVYLTVIVILTVLKSNPMKVRNVVQKVRQLKATPFAIRYLSSITIQKHYRLKLMKMTALKANNTANVIAKLLKQKVVGVYNINFNDYARTSANMIIRKNDELYLRNNKIVFTVSIGATYYIQSIKK